MRAQWKSVRGSRGPGSDLLGSFRPLLDTTPPTKPVVSVTDVGPTHASLTWAASDDGPNLWYTVWRDDTPVVHGLRATSAIIPFLEPETTYAFTVQASDFSNHPSPLSDPAAATTTPRPDDTTPPTTPANFGGDGYGDCEVALAWDETNDDVAPQWIIEYTVCVNATSIVCVLLQPAQGQIESRHFSLPSRRIDA